MSVLDRELAQSPYLAGDNYTIADISVFAYVHRASEAGIVIDDFTNVTRWIDQVKAQPGFLAKTYAYSIDPHAALELPA